MVYGLLFFVKMQKQIQRVWATEYETATSLRSSQ